MPHGVPHFGPVMDSPQPIEFGSQRLFVLGRCCDWAVRRIALSLVEKQPSSIWGSHLAPLGIDRALLCGLVDGRPRGTPTRGVRARSPFFKGLVARSAAELTRCSALCIDLDMDAMLIVALRLGSDESGRSGDRASIGHSCGRPGERKPH